MWALESFLTPGSHIGNFLLVPVPFITQDSHESILCLFQNISNFLIDESQKTVAVLCLVKVSPGHSLHFWA